MKAGGGTAIRKIARLLDGVRISKDPETGDEIIVLDRAAAALTDADMLAEIRKEIIRREARFKHLPAEIFGEPSWNVLLDLFDSQARNRDVTISDACVASRSPPTTALRWIARLVELGLVTREKSTADSRVVRVRLTDKARGMLASYFEEVWGNS